MSGPQPPIPPSSLGKTLVQKGGPVAVATGAMTCAITFPTAFPDTNYQCALEWVSGDIQPYAFRAKTVNSVRAHFDQVEENSAFNWRAWRLP